MNDWQLRAILIAIIMSTDNEISLDQAIQCAGTVFDHCKPTESDVKG